MVWKFCFFNREGLNSSRFLYVRLQVAGSHTTVPHSFQPFPGTTLHLHRLQYTYTHILKLLLISS